MSIKGFLYGLLSSATFGLIPLFTVPTMQDGMEFHSILIYRFAFACVALFAILIMEKKSLRISFSEGIRLFLLALFYDCSALFLFWGYTLMGSGVATTIHFMYPVMTAILMMLFFKEKGSLHTFIAIGLAIAGVVLLSQSKGDVGSMSFYGLFIVLLSALAYALYLVTVNQLKVRKMGTLKFTFYIFLFGLFQLWLYVQFSQGGVQGIPSWHTATNLVLLALIPTVLSNLALINAVKRIGSTMTSVMGALEPLTAVSVGILFLGEGFTIYIGGGIALIITAVLILILKGRS